MHSGTEATTPPRHMEPGTCHSQQIAQKMVPQTQVKVGKSSSRSGPCSIVKQPQLLCPGEQVTGGPSARPLMSEHGLGRGGPRLIRMKNWVNRPMRLACTYRVSKGSHCPQESMGQGLETSEGTQTMGNYTLVTQPLLENET